MSPPTVISDRVKKFNKQQTAVCNTPTVKKYFKTPRVRTCVYGRNMLKYLDDRFSSQFKAGKITKVIPYSKYPPCYKDVSFWLPNEFLEKKNHTWMI